MALMLALAPLNTAEQLAPAPGRREKFQRAVIESITATELVAVHG
jgi:hypothetical protein